MNIPKITAVAAVIAVVVLVCLIGVQYPMELLKLTVLRDYICSLAEITLNLMLHHSFVDRNISLIIYKYKTIIIHYLQHFMRLIYWLLICQTSWSNDIVNNLICCVMILLLLLIRCSGSGGKSQRGRSSGETAGKDNLFLDYYYDGETELYWPVPLTFM